MGDSAFDGRRDEFLGHLWNGWRRFAETEMTSFYECMSLLQTMDSEQGSLLEEYRTNVSNALDDMQRSFEKAWRDYKINNKV